jgi:hypothetical protein
MLRHRLDNELKNNNKKSGLRLASLECGPITMAGIPA